jgi:uncharacterized protein
MKKILSALVLAFVFCLSLPATESNSSEPGQSAIPKTRQKPRLVDDAGLLSPAGKNELLAKLDEISERQKFDVVVAAVKSLGGKTAEAYADNYYDYNGYGMGSGHDGILLLISMADRDWAITTHGFGIPAFTDAGQAYIVDRFRPDLSAGNYAAAFNRFADLCDDFLTRAKTGNPYDTNNLQNREGFWHGFLNLLVFSLPMGVILAFIITGIMKSSLKSVRMQAAANSYVREGSLNITDRRDVFLNRVVSKTARPKSSSGGRGGGSSIRLSSSGRSHGGSSGKF